ncbi:MAG: SUMF1/EgtB/PvdO family nonheme iron enzyme [Chloroflexota bacterium]
MKIQLRLVFIWIVILGFIHACYSSFDESHNGKTSTALPISSHPTASAVMATATRESQVGLTIPSSTPLPVATIDISTLPPNFWMDMPVVPDGISDRVREIYARGLLMGNNPNAFSKIGDCHSTLPYFLADFDREVYNLGEYEELQPAIEYFKGSFGRESLAAKKGLSTAGVLASLWSDWKQCARNETPLDCEFRHHRPSFAIISLGTNEAYDVRLDKTTFEGRLRRIIEHSIDQGVVPILSTKADNDEGDHYINFVTAKLALEYQLPLWNFWRAVQPLPQHGMRSADHLTFAPTASFTDFSKPEYLAYGMQIRNLTALQILDVIRREITRSDPVVSADTTAPTASQASEIYQVGEKMVSAVDGMNLVYIPAGEFEMGYTLGEADARPIHHVSLHAFWMDQTEVTAAMYAQFLNANGNQIEGGVPWLDVREPLVWVTNKNGRWESVAGRENYPIVGVSWYGAMAYCKWAGRSLPTEAQWEYAAGGSEGYRFPWGNDAPTCLRSQFFGCGSGTVASGSLPLGGSPFGVYEMAGNVKEWINDRYDADYYKMSPVENPPGASFGYYRVLRGGSWGSSYIELQSSHRDWAGADTQESDIGFRCVLNP